MPLPLLPPAWVQHMAAACAPHALTIPQIIVVESGGDPLAIRVNGLAQQPPKARSVAEATATANHYIALGYKVDLGWVQLDSANLAALGTTVMAQFDANSCANIQAGAKILTAAYEQGLQLAPPGQPALKVALSLYNTGNTQRGFVNGYVAKYYENGVTVPELKVPDHVAAVPRPSNPYAADVAVWFPTERVRYGD